MNSSAPALRAAAERLLRTAALGAATLVAVKFWHHPLGQELTGLQTLSFIVLPLFASFIPVVVMFFVGGKSEDHGSH
jgi:hypothetical protein